MLRMIEILHQSRIIHGDMKPDHLVLRTGARDSLGPRYQRDGSQGWRTFGLKTLDFGRSIDLAMYPANAEFVTSADKCDGKINHF